jgi:dynein light chain Tctex-type 1
MTTELQFAVIKDELTAMVDDIIRQFLNDKDYDKTQAQSWCNAISDEIIKALHQQQRGFKFVCISTILQKGYSSMNFSSTCLWNPNNDGSVTVKYENDKLHCFVCLFGLSP